MKEKFNPWCRFCLDLDLCIHPGDTEENLEKLMRHAGIPSAEAGYILNMQALGVKIVKEVC